MEHKAGHTALLYVSEWADAETAAEFFRLYQQVLRKKWQRVEIAPGSDDRFAGKSEDGYFLVRRQGVFITSVEGMRSPTEAR
jgi:hypothetical protein